MALLEGHPDPRGFVAKRGDDFDIELAIVERAREMHLERLKEFAEAIGVAVVNNLVRALKG